MFGPGEKKTVTFSLPVEQLSSWDTTKNLYAVSPAQFDVWIGSSSDDIRVRGTFEVTTAGQWPASTLTTKSALE